jgi:hypothetical protein
MQMLASLLYAKGLGDLWEQNIHLNCAAYRTCEERSNFTTHTYFINKVHCEASFNVLDQFSFRYTHTVDTDITRTFSYDWADYCPLFSGAVAVKKQYEQGI